MTELLLRNLVIEVICRPWEYLGNSNINDFKKGSFEEYTNALKVRELIRLVNSYRTKLDFGSVMEKGKDRDKVNFFFGEGMKLLPKLEPDRFEQLIALKKLLSPQNFQNFFACREYVQVESIFKETRETYEPRLKSCEEELKQILTKHSICLIGCEEDFDELSKWREYETKKEFIPGPSTTEVFIKKVLIPLHHSAGPLFGRALRQENPRDIISYWQYGSDREFAYLKGCFPPEVFFGLELFTYLEIPTAVHHFRWSSPGPETDGCFCSLFNLHWEWVWENIDKSLTVTIRVYGYHEEAKFGFERSQETDVALYLGAVEEAPQFLEFHDTFRIEKPMDTKTLSLTDLLHGDCDIPAAIAKKLYQFHHLHKYISLKKHICLWTRLRTWVDRLSQFGDSELNKEIKLKELGTLIDSFEDKHSSSLLGFCHNNIRVGNILRLKSKINHVFFTSYELASWNPVAFDISGFFWSLTADHETSTISKDKYPEKAFCEAFVRAYLGRKGSTSTHYKVNTLLQEVEDFSVVTHLYQGLWGLIYSHAKYSKGFYLTCAKIRLKWFWEKYADMQV